MAKAKKIIAREGLIIIGLLFVSIVLIMLGEFLSKREGLVTQAELKQVGVFDYKVEKTNQGFDPSSAVPVGSLTEKEIQRLAMREILKREGLHYQSGIVWLSELPENDPSRSESQEDMVTKNKDLEGATQALENLSDKDVAAFAKVSLGTLDRFAVQKNKRTFKFDFSKFGCGLLLLGYPLYLLAWFVTWAIKTLNKHS